MNRLADVKLESQTPRSSEPGELRVGQFVPFLNAGAGRAATTIANELSAECGWPVFVFAREVGQWDLSDGVTLIPLPRCFTSTSTRDVANLFRLPFLAVYCSIVARRHALDVCIGNCALFSTALVLARKAGLLPVPVIAYEHSLVSVRLGFRERLVRSVIAHVYSYADAVITVSEGVAAALRKLIRRDTATVIAIYNGFEIDQLVRLSEMETEQSESLKAEKRKKILYSGRLCKQKHPLLALDVLEIVLKELDAVLVVAGDGECLERVRAEVLRRGLTNNVIFLGNVVNLASVMRSCDVLLVTSSWETFCNVIVEGLAVGLPVVSTDCLWGPGEILENGRWGSLCPQGDANALAIETLRALAGGDKPTARPAPRALDFSSAVQARRLSAAIRDIVALARSGQS